jgi:hypothetical protein
VCKAGAINFDMKEYVRDLSVGAVIRDSLRYLLPWARTTAHGHAR